MARSWSAEVEGGEGDGRSLSSQYVHNMPRDSVLELVALGEEDRRRRTSGVSRSARFEHEYFRSVAVAAALEQVHSAMKVRYSLKFFIFFRKRLLQTSCRDQDGLNFEAFEGLRLGIIRRYAGFPDRRKFGNPRDRQMDRRQNRRHLRRSLNSDG